MSTETTRDHASSTYRHTGPVGRVVRLLLAALLGWTAYELWADRGFIFAETNPIADPTLWLFTALMVWGIHEVANFVGWGKRVLVGLGVLAVAAAVVALTVQGTIWTAPLTWLVWGIDIVAATLVTVTVVVAVVLRVPGCELGVLRRLVRRLRDDPDDAQPMFCLAGLHKLDVWESRMPWHRGR